MRHCFLFQPVAQPLQFRDIGSEPSRLLLRFPCNGPVITQTAKNFFPTSMPAHRSTAAQIMFALLCGLENSRRLPGICSSSAQLLHSGVLHVHLASFVFGSNCAPLPTTAALSSPAMDCTPPPFSFPGVAETGHPPFVWYFSLIMRETAHKCAAFWGSVVENRGLFVLDRAFCAVLVASEPENWLLPVIRRMQLNFKSIFFLLIF